MKVKLPDPAPQEIMSPAPAPRLVPLPRRGQPCPQCGHGRLEYDGLLNLSCPLCGYSAGGGACT